MDPSSRASTEDEGVVYVLTVVAGPDVGKEIRVDGARPTPALVGLSEACDLRLSDSDVSRRHAALQLREGRLHVSDLASTGGTFVDDVCVGDAYLSGGEAVRMGRTVLVVSKQAREDEAPPIPPATSFGRLIGASAEMRWLYPLCERLSASTVPVVIEGETGTGKEVLAESLHEQGPLAGKPFVVFDCTAVPANLVESELFGHERGAFTGAVSDRKGVFEQANGGTLLIDEIGDLDLTLQPKLLRALERSQIRRVGGDRPITVEVRILAATRRDLDHEVAAGLFRDDLFHRLAVARIELPPLRARHGDVAKLAAHFYRSLGADPEALDAELLRRWEDYLWPGNVRELRNAVARHLALGDLATHAKSGEHARVGDSIDRVLALNLPIGEARDRVIEEFERRYLERALSRNNGVVTEAAKDSGVARRHFQRLRARSAK
jgi:two-component system, NtrC family, response regulator HydG